MTDSLTGVKCRATSVAKKEKMQIQMENRLQIQKEEYTNMVGRQL